MAQQGRSLEASNRSEPYRPEENSMNAARDAGAVAKPIVSGLVSPQGCPGASFYTISVYTHLTRPQRVSNQHPTCGLCLCPEPRQPLRGPMRSLHRTEPVVVGAASLDRGYARFQATKNTIPCFWNKDSNGVASASG